MVSGAYLESVVQKDHNSLKKKEQQERKRRENQAIMASPAIKETARPTYSPGVFWAEYEPCGLPQCPIWPPEAERSAQPETLTS